MRGQIATRRIFPVYRRLTHSLPHSPTVTSPPGHTPPSGGDVAGRRAPGCAKYNRHTLDGRTHRSSSTPSFLLIVSLLSISLYLYPQLQQTTMGASRGDSLLQQADKKASSSTGWFSSSSSKWEDAADLYQQVRVHLPRPATPCTRARHRYTSHTTLTHIAGR